VATFGNGDDFLEDVKVFLDNVARDDSHKRPTFLVGHSHGALVAALAGARGALPAMVEGLVLLSPFIQSLTDVPPMKLMVARVANVVFPWLRLGSGLQADMMTDDPAMIEESHKDPLLLRSATRGGTSACLKPSRGEEAGAIAGTPAHVPDRFAGQRRRSQGRGEVLRVCFVV
jgi:alpha-beta hydrolase superfamily lysophospholipase